MKKSQLVLIAVAVGAVALIALISGGGGGKDDPGRGGGPTGTTAPSGAVKVTFAYSPEKEELLKPLIASFNASKPQAGGKQVFVVGENVSSGDAQLKIAKGTYKPTAWSPSSSMWGRLLNFEADQPYVAEENPSIVRTPLVIAMWEPMAKALGYPRKKLGFGDILKLARSNQGWAAYGHPEFGAFKLVHTNPDFSTSGLSAVVAEYYYATGKKEGLVEQDIAEGPRDGQGHRALDRPLRRHDAVHRRPAAQERPRLRLGRRDGGGDARRLQPGPRQPAEARRDLPRGGHVLLRQPVHRAERAVGHRRRRRPARRASASTSPTTSTRRRPRSTASARPTSRPSPSRR